MQVSVWDSYVTRKDGSIMHFDIIVPSELKNEAQIFEFGKAYLKSKQEEGQPLSASECKFCHVEQARPDWVEGIKQNGHFIYEMENC